MSNDLREIQMDALAERVCSYAHQAIWIESDLSAAEARLTWLQTIAMLLQSAWIDRKNDVVKEWMNGTEARNDSADFPARPPVSGDNGEGADSE